MDTINGIVNSILSLANSHPETAKYITTGLRWVFVLLAVWILLMCIISLLSTRATPEVWGISTWKEEKAFPSPIGKISLADPPPWIFELRTKPSPRARLC